MPRLSRSQPKYRKHRASGQAIVTIHGQDHYLGPWNTAASKTEYDRLVGEWIAAGRPLHPIGSAFDVSVAELCRKYWQFAKGYYVKNGKPTATQYGIKMTIKMLRTNYGPTRASLFGPLALKALQQSMISDGMSRRYINDHADRIRRIFKWAVGEELVPPSVHQALTAVPGLRKGRTAARETKPIAPVSDAVIDRMLDHLTPVVADMVRFQRFTGCRPGEGCIIRPCDVDRSDDIWEFRPVEHKTEHQDRDRVVFIGPRAQEILRPYLLRGTEEYCFSPAESERERLQLRHERRKIPIGYGNRPESNRKRRPKRSATMCYTPGSYRRAIHRACERAFPPPKDMPKEKHREWHKEQRWSPNQVRHTAATEIRRKFGLEAAQVALGHAYADVTQIYAERDNAAAANVMRQIG